MGIIIPRNHLTESGFKSRELANLLKEKIIFYICKVINEENAPEGFNTESGVPDDFLAVA